MCEEYRHGKEYQKEEHQKRLGGREERGLVVLLPPDEADAEGEDERQPVQEPPGAEPRDADHPRVEHGVVGEQRHVAAASGGGEDRRQESAARSDHRERHGTLHDRQHTAERDDHEQQAERERRRQQIVESKGSEDREVEHADGAALKHDAVFATGMSKAPANREQHQRAGCGAHQPVLDRQHSPLCRVPGGGRPLQRKR